MSKKIVEMVNKWGFQISIGGDSNINKQWDVYLALKSTFMMRGYGGSGKNAHAAARLVREHYQG